MRTCRRRRWSAACRAPDADGGRAAAPRRRAPTTPPRAPPRARAAAAPPATAAPRSRALCPPEPPRYLRGNQWLLLSDINDKCGRGGMHEKHLFGLVLHQVAGERCRCFILQTNICRGSRTWTWSHGDVAEREDELRRWTTARSFF